MRARLASRLAVTPDQYRKVTYRALFMLSLIVFTGAAVRLTSSGLGCPTWPKCYGRVYPPVQTHALIEFGNRVISGLVGIGVGVTAVLAFTRRPFRRDLAWLACLLPLGVVAQAVLGGYTVREKLAPGFVMAHFGLSMLILIPAVALAWRATYEPGSRPRSTDRALVWTVRALGPLGALTIFAGTAATASGPHSGGGVGQHIVRLTFKGADTLEWVVHQHATIAVVLGLVTIAAWLLKRRQGAILDPLEPLTVLAILLASQGLVGSVQYELGLPAEIVWVHVILATVTWVVILWAIVVEGRLVPRAASVPAADPAAERKLGSLQGV
ncbi:MAG: COX15/CtaA family protein [Solirubrobacteraceae bacterium]